MPLYEYECESCHHRFEKIRKFSDPPLEICPSCGGKINKLVSSPAIQFKGTGWYITDYAKKSGTDSSPKPSSSPSASSSETNTSSTTPAPSSTDSKKSADSKKE